MKIKSRIAVIGCGIAGSVIALLLKRQGHEVTVFEQASELRPIGAGVLLQPVGQCVLQKLGLLDEVVQHAEPIHELHAVYRSRRTMIRMPFQAARIGMHAYGVHRGDIFWTFAKYLRQEDVHIVLSAKVTSIQASQSHVAVLLEDERRFEDFDYAVIANGSKSNLRRLDGLRGFDSEYDYAAIWCNARSENVRGKLFQVVEGTHRLMGVLPLGQGRASLFWGITKQEKDACMSQNIHEWQQQLKQFYPDVSEVVDTVQDWSQATFGTYRRASVKPSFTSRLIFMGDAAHAMSPHLGQGLNFALLDAYRFASCVEGGDGWLDACEQFVRERKSHLRYYSFITGLLTPFFQSHSVWKGWFRDATLPWLHRTPIIRHQMALTMTGMKADFFRGRLTIK